MIAPVPGRGLPTHRRLQPGEHCRISEDEWAAVLTASEPLHQWGSAFLVDEGPPGHLVAAYVRDDSGAKRHTAFRFDAARSARARQGVEQVEALARAAADLVSAQQETGASLEQLDQQRAASDAYVAAAEALYRELLALGPRP
jgi:hypothetical protein